MEVKMSVEMPVWNFRAATRNFVTGEFSRF